MSEKELAHDPDGVRREIRAGVAERFPLARQRSLADDAPLLESGIVDSLGILELVNFLTERFGIPISDEDLLPENFQTIDAMVRFVDGKR